MLVRTAYRGRRLPLNITIVGAVSAKIKNVIDYWFYHCSRPIFVRKIRCCKNQKHAPQLSGSLRPKTSKIRVFCHFLRARLYMMQFLRIEFNIFLLFTIFYVRNSIFQNNFGELSGAARALKMKKVARTRASAFFTLEVPQRLQIVHRWQNFHQTDHNLSIWMFFGRSMLILPFRWDFCAFAVPFT